MTGTSGSSSSSSRRRRRFGNRFSDKYWVDEMSPIAKGKDTVVHVCWRLKDRARLAVKTVEKSKVRDLSHLRNEINLMSELKQHPNINTLIDVFEDDKCIHLISDLCTGGHLSSYIQSRVINNPTIDYKLHEQEASYIIKQILDAMEHCHDKKIVHRDLKLENVLFRKNRKLEIRLIDFDISTKHSDDDDPPLTNFVGTKAYMAPEVFDKKYNKRCDIWSIGVIAHALLCGELPFSGSDDVELANQIKYQPIAFDSPAWEELSSDAKDFVSKCLEKDPSKRTGLAQLLTHEWMDLAMPPIKPEKARVFKKIRLMLEDTFTIKMKNTSSSFISPSATAQYV
jgi:calcium-dependent protein kinase